MSGDQALRDARRRLRPRPEPGAWLATIVRAIEAQALDDGHSVVHLPAHFLVAAWAPQPGGLHERLPEFAAIASPDADRALGELFVHLPPQVPVHLVDDRHVDLALVAQMVLVCDRNLEPYQRAGLERFAHERQSTLLARIADRYTDREAGFDAFRSRLLGRGSRDDDA